MGSFFTLLASENGLDGQRCVVSLLHRKFLYIPRTSMQPLVAAEVCNVVIRRAVVRAKREV